MGGATLSPTRDRLPVVVVGAGAAGMMAAIFAAREGCEAVLLERTGDGGRKILISGGGRCNILPSTLDPARFVTDSSPNTLRKILRSWPLAEQRRFFEKTLDLPLVLEPESSKIFPASNRASDVRDGLLTQARHIGVQIRFNTSVNNIRPVTGRAAWEVHLANDKIIMAGAVVLATGGLSAAATGSDGTGLRMARGLGHVIHDTYPALTPLTADPPVHASLAGVSLTVTLRATAGGKRIAAYGGLLFTHRGYSGPSVLNISHVAVRARLRGEAQPILVQWSPLDAAAWENLLRKRSIGLVLTALRQELPARLAAALLAETGVAADRRLSHLRRDERLALIELLVRYPLPWTDYEGYRTAEVTGGGVDLGDVNPRTLESRRHAGLFMCGEMLDAFGPIGGHNFAWAWATGRAAGIGAGRTRPRSGISASS